MAAKAPGGVVRWVEAKNAYIQTASRYVAANRGFHQNIGRIFKKYFERVKGVRGHYVLRQTIDGGDNSDDVKEVRMDWMEQFDWDVLKFNR